ncbi:nickel-dependent lactate racemase [Deltaproteobacteria bacterium OttesenSCG-928-M10]|nr:nickel-dependent lactate racemase [Deltaproteobacteria bacterium OttesenSCG-928-M10]
MKMEIGFGACPQTVEIPDRNLDGVLLPNEIETAEKGEALVLKALKNPIGSKPLDAIVKPGEKVVVITSDVTRPVPSYKIIPGILNELWRAGVKAEDVTVVFALGSHRFQTQEEMKKLVGEKVFNQVRCIDGDPEDYVHLGQTKMGTPVDITRVVAEADRRICVSNIEYHYFAGYSGGAKAIMPGVSTRAAIQSNHSRMVLPEAAAGRLDGNPVREDIEEAIGFCPIDFIVNVVLDEKKEIVCAVAGHHVEAHRAGCRFLDSLYLKPIDHRADIVIASQGGAPKDLNLYQTQKALDNAKNAVKKGGIIILVGSCKEGLGEHVFEEWMTKADTPASMVERIQKDFQLGGHKAAAIALVLANSDIFLVSEMPPDFVENIFLKPYQTVQSALDDAFKKLGPQASVLVMPYAGSTLPVEK